MTTPETFWIGTVFVADWALVDLDGAPVDGADVTGTVTLPSGGTAAMTVAAAGGGTGRYRASYQPATAGLHAYRLIAAGSGLGAEEGTFIVRTDLVGAPPITLDPTTPTGQVRLLISDTDEANPVFTDPEISGFLTLGGQRVMLAAAHALDTLASNEVLVSKVIRTQDLQTDGSKVSAELRARAATLREQDDLVDDNGDPYGLTIVDYSPRRAQWHEAAEIPWLT